MTFGELLASFKIMGKAYTENFLMLAEDVALRNGLLAWQSMTIDYDDNAICPEEIKDEKRQWEWIWKVVKIDYKKFGVIAGIKEYEGPHLIDRLKALRLIYPDGTASAEARGFLREQVVSHRPGWQYRMKQKLKDKEKAEERAGEDAKNNDDSE